MTYEIKIRRLKQGVVYAAALAFGAVGFGVTSPVAAQTGSSEEGAVDARPGSDAPSADSRAAHEEMRRSSQATARDARDEHARENQESEREGAAQERRGTQFTAISPADRRHVQERLQSEGHYQGEIDGVWGPLTRRAVMDFQRAAGIAVNGRLNQATMRLLDVDANEQIRPVSGTRATAAGQVDNSNRNGTVGNAVGAGRAGENTIRARGSYVREAQQALSREGFLDGAVDGVLGPQTASSIRAYQRANGMPQTGRLDAQTLRSLGVERRAAAPGASPDDANVQNTRGTVGATTDRAANPNAGQRQPPATRPSTDSNTQ